MKKYFAAYLILLTVFLVGYFVLDRQLYYYGKSNFCLYQKLPLKIKPQYWGCNMGNLGFVLVDEIEVTLIAPGSKYWTSDLVVNEIVKYGYANEKLVALVTDTIDNKFYIECTENRDVDSKHDIVIRVLDDTININLDEYTWVEINEAYFRSIELIRNYLVIAVVISIIGSIFIGIRRKNL